MTELQAIRRLIDTFPGARAVDLRPFPPQEFLDREREVVARSDARKAKAKRKKKVDALRGTELSSLSGVADT